MTGYRGPVIAIYPGPLLGNDQVRTLTETEMEGILGLIEEIAYLGW